MESRNFIEEKIENEGAKNIHTRFPPEPNGYLHIGHAKSICLNFGLAEKYNGECNLRFDDTNPSTEDTLYVEAIKKDIEWLGFKPNGEYYTSDYFSKLYKFGKKLILSGDAYVCELSPDEVKNNIKTPTEPGIESPYRERDVYENLSLFGKMRDGDFEDGSMTLRAKIDMSSPNMHMRDPIIYRIKKEKHHRSGDDWCIYPMYDFAHCLSDAIESITHSICTLEFEVHRPLYDWIIDKLIVDDLILNVKPKQTEFSRLNLTHTIMSKRKLKELVDSNIVDGWDDPRLPTISGLRRRGYTPNSIRNFCEKVGVSRKEGIVDVALLESCVREDLNKTSNRRMVVFNPLKVTITNWDGDMEWMSGIVNPETEDDAVRMINFGKNLYIEREDFMEDAPKKFFRLTKDKEVRFKYGYYVTCNEVIKDENGEVIELLCTYDPATKGGWSDDGRKVKGTIHWVNADKHIPIKVNLYDRLFNVEETTDDFLNEINPDSMITVDAMMEAAGKHHGDERLQFERNGYYAEESENVWNKTVGLRDNWNKSK